jgi:hypothetical protein
MAMVVVMAAPMSVALLSADVGRGLSGAGLRLHRIIGSVGGGTSHQGSRADSQYDSKLLHYQTPSTCGV